MDGHKIESLEVIVDNEQGLNSGAHYCPSAVSGAETVPDAMYASLKDKQPPDVWDYPTP